MSFILNALRKSEQERQKLQANSLISDQSETPKKYNERNLFIYGFIFFTVNLILTLGIISLIRTPASLPKFEVKDTSEKEPQAQLIEPVKKTVDSEKEPQAQLIEPVKKTVDLVHVDSPTELPNTRLVEEKPNNTPVPPITKPVTPKPQIINKPPKEVLTENTPQPVTPVPIPEASTQKQDLPYLRELPFRIQNKVPNLAISVFVYSDEPSERFVIINSNKYKVGQSLPNGINIKDITSNNLVLEYQNQVFQIKRP